ESPADVLVRWSCEPSVVREGPAPLVVQPSVVSIGTSTMRLSPDIVGQSLVGTVLVRTSDQGPYAPPIFDRKNMPPERERNSWDALFSSTMNVDQTPPWPVGVFSVLASA